MNLDPVFRWKYPADACLPDGFHLVIARDPSFTEVTFENDYNFPADSSGWHSIDYASMGLDLDPGLYYWDVAATVDGWTGPYTDLGTFFFGPRCFDISEEDFVQVWPQPPNPLWPPDGGILYSNDIYDRALSWDYPICTLSFFQTDVVLARDPEFTIPFGEMGLMYGWWPIPQPLSDCTEYYWQVRVRIPTGGDYGLIGMFDPAPDPNYTPPANPTPRPTPIPSYSEISDIWTFYTDFEGTCDPRPAYHDNIPEINEPPTPIVIVVTTSADMNCRQGPDKRFPVTGYFERDTLAELQGRLVEGNWFYLQLPQDLRCWVWGENLNFEGDWRMAPIVVPPPLPGPEPTGPAGPPICRPEMKQQDCEAAGGVWDTLQPGKPDECDCP